MAAVQTYFRTGKYMQAGWIDRKPDIGKIDLTLPFAIKDEAKTMQGARWCGYDALPRKVWEVDICEHNEFRLAYLTGANPYTPYEVPLIEFTPIRPLYAHQTLMCRHGLTRHYCILSCEMGTGKTLAAIEMMEYCVKHRNVKDIWYIAPKSALAAVQLEFYKWKCAIQPKFMTYEALIREMKNWLSGMPAPQMVFFDESSKIKTPTSQRTQAASSLAAGVRGDWDKDGYVILMSGSPAPKSPADWWSQCQTARPGFLREGNIYKFQNRLAIVKQEEGSDGVKYNKVLGWKDNVNKCEVCTELQSAYIHTVEGILCNGGHEFKACPNEIEGLYQRMKGLVLVQFKKDCLDLPTKVYSQRKCKPSISCMNAARLIQKTATRAAEVLVRLRELSDGFQYDEQKVGTEICDRCKGQRETLEDVKADDGTMSQVLMPCNACYGSGKKDSFKRVEIRVDCPKDQAVLDILEDHEDIGRLVIFGGFTATIDRLHELVNRAGWKAIVVDGRGWRGDIPGDNLAMLKAFQDWENNDDKICFVGHPGSCGMGLTLTASPTILYYSNDFNAESRIQSEDRVHRPGSRGANIIDLIHLPTDLMVLDNLKKKRDLQAMTMGDLAKAMENETNVIA